MPNFIRTKQIDQNDLSGFFVDSISSESGLLLDFAEQAALAVFSSGAVLLTGNQTISGVKNFATGIFAPNLVYNTGDQIISGIKTFVNNLFLTGSTNQTINLGVGSVLDLGTKINISTGLFGITSITRGGVTPFQHGYGIVFGGGDISSKKGYLTSGPSTPTGYEYATLDWVNKILSGTWRADEIKINQQILAPNLIYTTGNQTISGTKTFAQTGSFDTIQITNKKLSSYNYVNSNFTFGDIYINIVNSSNNIIGTLPSGITSGINYYVKNLNTGILLITGSGQRTIDGFSNINLYKNESLQLLGVNNVGYTGWVTLSADNGVS